MSSEASEQWTLDSELMRLSRTESTSAALLRLGLIDNEDDEFVLIPRFEKWVRGGAETYVFRFAISTAAGCRELILKACVPFMGGTSVAETLGEWIARRKLLAQHGIITPKLYVAADGALLEEFVPFSLRDLLSSQPVSSAILEQLARLSLVVGRLGFNSIDPFSDLRSHGQDVVFIDFGEDLGPANQSPSDDGRYVKGLRSWLEGVTGLTGAPHAADWATAFARARDRFEQ